MLGSALPATASVHTTTSSATPTSPTRSSRLRGFNYLRNYTHSHLHTSSSRSENTPPLTRSTSSPTQTASEAASRPRAKEQERARHAESTIQNGENGWLPTVQGRSGLSRDSLNPTHSPESAQPESSGTATMTRNQLGPVRSLPSPIRVQSSAQAQVQAEASSSSELSANMAEASNAPKDSQPTIRFIPHLETRSNRPSLHFTAVARTLKAHNSVVRVGRYSERDTVSTASPAENTTFVPPVGFKSKVVSRRHCEFWCTNGQWYVKDVKSSSGTFLNHVRLSSPGQESRPYPVNDGDVVQLGIDFKGGEEVIFRCVKIRIECNRGWQKSLNSFNTSAHRRLLKAAHSNSKGRDSDATSTSSSECSICLNPVAPCQALFVAPCSHVWHYKCVKNLIQGPNWPNFICPNCRFVADLEADVEQPEDFEYEAAALEEEEEEEERSRSRDENSSEDEIQHMSGDGEEGSNSGGRDGALSKERNADHSCRQNGRASLRATKSQSAEAATSSSSTSRPVSINAPQNHQRAPSADLLSARSATPTSNAQFALAAGVMSLGGPGQENEGPITPKNDAGPFVLDGISATTSGNLGLAAQALAEVSEASSSQGRSR